MNIKRIFLFLNNFITLENSFPQSPFKDLTPISGKLFLINTQEFKNEKKKIVLGIFYFVIYFMSNLLHLAHFWWFELIKNTFLRDKQENIGKTTENNFDLSAVRKLNNWANRSISCGRKINDRIHFSYMLFLTIRFIWMWKCIFFIYRKNERLYRGENKSILFDAEITKFTDVENVLKMVNKS